MMRLIPLGFLVFAASCLTGAETKPEPVDVAEPEPKPVPVEETKPEPVEVVEPETKTWLDYCNAGTEGNTAAAWHTVAAMRGTDDCDTAWSKLSDDVLLLGGKNIVDLTPLAGMTHLTNLDLGQNEITDVTPLMGMVELRVLILKENKIDDISPLKALSKMLRLDLSKNQIGDFAPLAGLNEMNKLNIKHNPGLAACPKSTAVAQALLDACAEAQLSRPSVWAPTDDF